MTAWRTLRSQVSGPHSSMFEAQTPQSIPYQIDILLSEQLAGEELALRFEPRWL